jgi:hypothetical protein
LGTREIRDENGVETSRLICGKENMETFFLAETKMEMEQCFLEETIVFVSDSCKILIYGCSA